VSKKISFVIPFIHEYPNIYLTINNIQSEMWGSKYEWEIIAAENGTQDVNTPKAFTNERALYRVPMGLELIKYVFEPRQCGPLARNAGARIADGDFVMFMDAHTTLGKDTVEVMADYLEEHPECGCVMGMTGKSHYSKPHMGAFYELFNSEKEKQRRSGPNLTTHMHGHYMGLRSVSMEKRNAPFQVVMSTQAYVMYRLADFWELGGYFDGCRFYPHPEGYMPLKVWMSGMECVTHPDSWHLHGQPGRRFFQTGPERRKKVREYGGYDPTEHGWMNVLKIAYILGGDKWIDICQDALMYKHLTIRPEKMEEMYKLALKVAGPERKKLKPKFKYKLDDILIRARVEGIAGMEKWDARIGDDPLVG